MNAPAISDREFALFQRLMQDLAGVHLPPAKKTLVSGRLQRRLHHLGMTSFGDYFRSISAGGNPTELQQAVDLLTTHETYFFREPKHFDFLSAHVVSGMPAGGPCRVWSAAASTGEEAYSIAMVLADRCGLASSWEVLGTDIASGVLELARAGAYRMDRSGGIPKDYLRRYCLRGVGAKEGTLLVAPELRSRVGFQQANLLSPTPGLGCFDVIFLRNVLIYFALPTKRQVVERLLAHMRPGGWLFIGHSESLAGVTDRLEPVQPTIYRRR